MGRVARLGVVCLMGLAVGLARLVEVELDPGARTPLVVALPPAAIATPEDSPAPVAAPAPPAPTAAEAAPPAPGPVAGAADADWPTGRVYVVQSGDTLGTISQKVFGTAKHWKRIHDANRKSIPDPGRMRAGTRLVLPEAPAVSDR